MYNSKKCSNFAAAFGWESNVSFLDLKWEDILLAHSADRHILLTASRQNFTLTEKYMSLLLHVMAWVTGISVDKLADFSVDPRCLCFLCPPKFLIKPMRPLIINHFHISGNSIAGDFIEIHDNPSASFYQRQHVPFYTTSTATVEDVMPVDTSFFGTDRYTAEVCEKNLREAIDLASGKADGRLYC